MMGRASNSCLTAIKSAHRYPRLHYSLIDCFDSRIYSVNGEIIFEWRFCKVHSIFSDINKQKTTNIEVTQGIEVNSYLQSHFSSPDTYQCEGEAKTTKSRLAISFTIDYTNGCNIPHCQRKFLAELRYKISILYKSINLVVTFADNEEVTLELMYCTLMQTDASEYLPYVPNRIKHLHYTFCRSEQC